MNRNRGNLVALGAVTEPEWVVHHYFYCGQSASDWTRVHQYFWHSPSNDWTRVSASLLLTFPFYWTSVTSNMAIMHPTEPGCITTFVIPLLLTEPGCITTFVTQLVIELRALSMSINPFCVQPNKIWSEMYLAIITFSSNNPTAPWLKASYSACYLYLVLSTVLINNDQQWPTCFQFPEGSAKSYSPLSGFYIVNDNISQIFARKQPNNNL